eukprot:594853-Pleurochrysis_carterae.AAC.1
MTTKVNSVPLDLEPSPRRSDQKPLPDLITISFKTMVSLHSITSENKVKHDTSNGEVLSNVAVCNDKSNLTKHQIR